MEMSVYVRFCVFHVLKYYLFQVAAMRRESDCASKAMEQSDMKIKQLGDKIRESSKMVCS
jgi:hypothetical protein